MTDSTRKTITKFVVQLIEENGKLPAGCDVETFNYIDNGYVDSIGVIKFIIELGAEYDIEISDSDIEDPQFRTIGGVVSIIQKKTEL